MNGSRLQGMASRRRKRVRSCFLLTVSNVHTILGEYQLIIKDTTVERFAAHNCGVARN